MLSKSAKTRQFIIEKAAPLFNKKGYAGTSMQDLLDETGLTKGSLYGNFEGKDEIAACAFDHAYSKLVKDLRVVIKNEANSPDKLIAILDFYKNYSLKPHTEGGCPLLNTAVDSDDQLPFLKEKAARGLSELLDSLVYIIRKGVDRGELRKELKPTEEAALIFSVIEGGLMMSKLTDNPSILNKLLIFLKDRVLTRYIA